MTTIQAYRRSKTYVHEFPNLRLEFQPNVFGHVVCDVQEEWAVERLLQTPTGFRLYDTDVVPVELSEALKGGNVATGTDLQEPVEQVKSLADPDPVEKIEPVARDRGERFVLVSETGNFDLRPLSDIDLHAFAKANGVAVHPNAKGDTIRAKIVEALSKE